MNRLLGMAAFTVGFGTFALTGCGVTVEVAPKTVNGSLSLLPSPVTLTTDQSVQMVVYQMSSSDSGMEDVTKTAVWQSSSDADLPIANGKATCKHAGSYKVTASTLGGLSSSTPLTCVAPAPAPPAAPPAPAPAPAPAPPAPAPPTAPTLSAIAILNPPSIVRSNAPHPLSAQGTYNDQSVSDLTSQTTWKGDNVARVSSTGVLYCNTAGTSTITATIGSYTSTAQVICLLESITAPPGFVEHSAHFYGPFRSWLDAKADYGAKGDGTTDDTNALQNAITGAALLNRTLWIPQGTYLVSSTLHVAGAQGITITGSDPATTHILWQGAANHTIVSFEGATQYHVSRLWLDGNNQSAMVAISLDFSAQVANQMYPTYDGFEDLHLSGVDQGFNVGFAGETTVNRVHFENTTHGVVLNNYNALNFNVTDSLFTDNTVGLSNEPGAGAFNVSNSVFVRSKEADMKMGNLQAFSVRHNLSVDSQAFFVAGPINGGAAVTLEGNVVRSPKGIPIQYGNQGAVVLVDNRFEMLADPTRPIFYAQNYGTTYVVSVGNQFTASTPYRTKAGSQISVRSFDEAPMQDVPASPWQVPSGVYVPPASTLPVIEVAGVGVDSIQNAVNSAMRTPSAAVVHVPFGSYYLNTTLDVPHSSGLTIIGDGQSTNVIAGPMLSGPVVHTHGSVNIGEMVIIGTNINPTLQVTVPDQPSTTVLCDSCTTVNALTGMTVSGLDNAVINMRETTLNGLEGVHITGGSNQSAGRQTLGRVDAFMSTSEIYKVVDGGHFLISDGWHDGGQGPVQSQISGGAVVTHEGGTILTKSDTGVQVSGLTGRLSMVGVNVGTTISADSTSVGTLGLIGNLTSVVSNELSAGPSLKVVRGGDVVNTQSGMVHIDQSFQSSADIEGALAQSRTEFVVPREQLGTSATFVRLHRITAARGLVGMSFSSDQAMPSAASYSITGPLGDTVPANCAAGSMSLNGVWNLTAGGDGFVGLMRNGVYLTNTVTSPSVAETLGTAPSMMDAGQRWTIQPAGDGLFHVVNRADGRMLTRMPSGCAVMGGAKEDSSREWAVAAK